MGEKLLNTRNSFRNRIIWIALFILPLLFYPKALTSSWVSNSDVHALLEFWASIIALTAAGIILIHFFATGRRFFLLISLGFTLQGSEDLIHAIYSFSRIWPAEQAGIVNFVPGTYVSGRLVLIICVLLALFLGKSVTAAKNRTKEAILYNSVGFLSATVATAIIINSPLPRFILKGFISRPVDFAAAIVYLVAFFLFVKAYQKEENHTPFMWAIIGSIIFGFVTQIYMVHSQQLYDAQFDMSHIVKIFSYIFPIFGIAIGTFTMYKKEGTLTNELSNSIEREKESRQEAVTAKDAEQKKAKELASLNEELESSNEEIRQANEELESSAEELRVANEEAQKAKEIAEKKAAELEKFNKVAVGRELKMKELKAKIEELEQKLRGKG